MSTLIKYIIYLFIFITLIIVYFLFTPWGNQHIYDSVSSTLSKDTDLNVEVKSIDLLEYPYLESDLLVEGKYKLKVKGYLQDDHVDMEYRLTSNCLQNDICTIEDEIDITGHMSGPSDSVHVTGKGKALDGNVTYDLKKKSETYKDLTLVMQDVNSSKLFILLGKDPLFKGKANADIHFDHIGEKHKKGNIVYEIRNEDILGISVDLQTKINVIDSNHSFVMNVTAQDLTLDLSEGYYDQEKAYGRAFYTLDIEELSTFEKLTKEKLTGPFYAIGEVEYDNSFMLKGLSKSLGGLLDFIYQNNILQVNFDRVPSTNIIQRLSSSALIDANITGSVNYDLQTETVKAKAKLTNAKLISSELLETLSEKSGVDLSKEIFDKSDFDIIYKENTLRGDLHFTNAENHLLLDNTTINFTKRSIDTLLDLKTKKHHIAGKTYLASLDDTAAMQNSKQDYYLRYNGTYNKHYSVQLNGLINENWVNMDYVMNAGRLPSHICTIEDDINISGHLNGPFSQLQVTGKGKAMNGTVTFSGIKVADTMQNLTVSMNDIHALKLSTLLGQNTFPHGRADLKADFAYLSNDKKRGNLTYTFKMGTFSKLPFTLKAQVDVENEKQNFAADMTLANAKINISKGTRNANTNLMTAFYVVDVKELSEFEELLGFRYQGPLYAMGETIYTDHLKIQGLSKSFGGMADFVYENDKLDIDLTKVSFKRFMSLFPHPVLLDADTSGKIRYDFIQKRMVVNTELENAKFLPSDMVSTIYKKSEVNMLVEEFDDSTLQAVYQNNILRGDLKLANNNSFFYLTNTTLNTDKNTIDAYFDFKMQDQKFTGKVYGSVNDPKVNLNMQKLIRHKMDEQMDSMVGEGNRKMMEKMPMGETAKDAASGVAGGFMGVFF